MNCNYQDISQIDKSNSLIWEEVYNKLPEEIKIKYINLMNTRFDIKYALRTINIIISKETYIEMQNYYIEDLNSGSWTIDIVDNEKAARKYFKEYTMNEFFTDLIVFCEEWE